MKYLLSKFGFYVIAFFAAVTINFFLPRLMPGDPVKAYLATLYQSGSSVDPDTVQALEKLFGFNTDEPLIISYGRYVGNIFTGNWGTSIRFFPQPVTQALGRGLKWTLFLVGTSIVISYTITTFLGILVAWKRGSKLDSILTVGGQLMTNIPSIIIALGLMFIFASQLGWFPSGYAYAPLLTPGFDIKWIGSVAYHAILPVTSIVILGLGGIMGMRANMINQLGEDYIVMGWAKGVPDHKVMFSYGARNAMLPVVTSFAMSIGFIFGGSIITEIVFNYPGLGLVIFQGFLFRDYPLIQGQLLLTTLMVLSANFIADIAILLLDPRLRRQGR